ncbi:AAA family ATPase [Paracoccus luteus]|uniref:AAA family ATPase n=1 Tax=Paracoccus luteus TaxID=2508543 RepID=UPI00142F7697|nr:AAA family ATPase [Paracoccus luteus]
MTCLEHFGLRQAPFGLSPDPALFYVSRAHQRALDWIEDGIAARAPVLALTGAAGTGKTTLLRLLLDRHAGDWTAGLVTAAHGGSGDILSQARQALRLPDQGDGPGVAPGRPGGPAPVTPSTGRVVVLMVDDAQALDAENLSALAALAAERAGGGASTLLLAGGPELRALLDAPGLRSLGIAHAVLAPLGAGDTAGYVGHRLARSGARAPIFDADAMQVLHSLAEGVPLVINVMAGHCLTAAAAAGVSRLDGDWVGATLHHAGDELRRFADTVAQGRPRPADGPATGTPESAPPQHLTTARAAGRAAQPVLAGTDPALAPAAPQAAPAVAEPHGEPQAWDGPSDGDPPVAVVDPRRADPGPYAAPPVIVGPDQAPYPVVDPVPLSRRRPGLHLLAVAAVLALAGGAAWVWYEPPTPDDTGVPSPSTGTAEQASSQPAPSPVAPQPLGSVPPPVAITPEPTVAALMQRALEVETYDPAQAALAYARAAIRGDGRAAYYLGQLHETGTGVAPSPGLARLWYAAAADLPAAQRRLQALSAADAPPGTPAQPVPIFQARPSNGVSEMIWQVPAGVTPVRFRVETVGPSDEPMPGRETEVPGLIVPTPVIAWRVVAIGADGTESAPSATVRMIPEVVPPLERTLRWLRIEPR